MMTHTKCEKWTETVFLNKELQVALLNEKTNEIHMYTGV